MTKIRSIGTLALLGMLTLGIGGEARAQSQSWFKQIANGKVRFKVLAQFNKEAVVDRETGLVWEINPSSSTSDWDSAVQSCWATEVGGRKGWRLPSAEELNSLVDTTESNPSLPNKHPFTNVGSDQYWTATTSASNTGSITFAQVVVFSNGFSGNGTKTLTTRRHWCVRGGQGDH